MGAGASPLRAPAPAAGWHPVDGNPYDQGYFDGNAWTARARWDRTTWVVAG